MATASSLSETPIGIVGEAEDSTLAQAFADFGRVAASLESSYARLHTEVQRLHAELETRNRELAHALAENRRMRSRQVLAELSAVLAHEVRNPLGSLELFASLLARSDLAADARQWVKQLQAGLRRLAVTVNNVLQLYSEPPSQPSAVDLGELIEGLKDFLLPLAEAGGVHLECTRALAGVCIEGDRQRLEQALLNLALNSLQFMPQGGVLCIGGEAGNRQRGPRLAVADSGPGIAAENLSRVFEAGFTTRSGSPGLGLAVCKQVMKQHDGSIQALSPPGEGARFILQFPRAGETA